MEYDPDISDPDELEVVSATERFADETVPWIIPDGFGGNRKLRMPRKAILESGINLDSEEEEIELDVIRALLDQAIDPDTN